MRLTARAQAVVLALIGLVVSAGAVIMATSHLSGIRPPPLAVLGAVPDFSLIDQRGRTCSSTSLAGSVWIADFIFTRCAGQCPLMSARMASLDQALARQGGLRFVSFSVDPAHDDPAALAAYAGHYGARDGRWEFLTGSPQAVRTLVQDGFKLGLSDDGTPQEPITHSVHFVLIDRALRIRGYYDATEDEAMRRLQADARSLLREP